jgi:acyl-ACP thioesterase
VGGFECDVEKPYTVAYSDIDFNGHVGSMKDLEWMIDTLPPDIPAGLSALRFDINYAHEALLGQPLVICRASGGNTHNFDIRNNEGTSICKATITTM